MTSDEGLNAYGAVTWGQPFIYQGFNEHVGFMHTTSTLDAVDEFAETVTQKNGKYFYRYGNEDRPRGGQAGDHASTAPPTAAWPDACSPPTPPTTVPIVREEGRQVDQLCHDEQAGGGAGAKLAAHQGRTIMRPI